MEEIKSINIGKDKIKVFLYTDDMIIYKEILTYLPKTNKNNK